MNTSSPCRLPFRSLAIATQRLAVLAALGVLPACTGAPKVGSIEVASVGPRPLVLSQEFQSGVYTRSLAEEDYWFADTALESLLGATAGTSAYLHAQLVWTPEAGKTPLTPTATNLVLRLIAVSNGEVGLYGGAAFARPSGGSRGKARVLSIEGGTLTLLEKTAGFHDLLTPATLVGALEAVEDDRASLQWRRALAQFTTNAFGRSMWVFVAPENRAAPGGSPRARVAG